jgi:hypothetical protein
MRTQFLRALARPIEDLKVGAKNVERFREPVAVLRAVEARADMAERALETTSLGLALLEICVRAASEEES